jgi:hypothetical protein
VPILAGYLDGTATRVRPVQDTYFRTPMVTLLFRREASWTRRKKHDWNRNDFGVYHVAMAATAALPVTVP